MEMIVFQATFVLNWAKKSSEFERCVCIYKLCQIGLTRGQNEDDEWL